MTYAYGWFVFRWLNKSVLYSTGPIDQQHWYECLVDDLFESSKYSPLVRPVRKINDTITIDFSIQLSQIISVVSIPLYFNYNARNQLDIHDELANMHFFLQGLDIFSKPRKFKLRFFETLADSK